jgi:hypothetical protein
MPLLRFPSGFYADKIPYRAGLRKLAEKLCPMRKGLLSSVLPQRRLLRPAPYLLVWYESPSALPEAPCALGSTPR